jgi:flagellar protein FlgJ
MIEKISSDPILANASKDINLGKLKKACSDFESLFINYMLKSMRSSIQEGGIFEHSEESKMFRSMFDEKLADEISSSGGLGLGETLYKRLKDQYTP